MDSPTVNEDERFKRLKLKIRFIIAYFITSTASKIVMQILFIDRLPHKT